MILHIIFIAIYIFLDNILGLEPEFINAAIIVHCTIALLGVLNRNRRIFQPLTVFYFSGIIASSGNIVVIGQSGIEKSSMNAYMIASYLPEASSIWAIGVSFIFIGYEFFSTRSFPSLRLDVSRELAVKMFSVVLFISVFVQQIIFYLSFLGSVSKLLYLIGTIGILFYARLWAVTNDRKFMTYGFILLVIQTYSAFQTSYLRSELLLPTAIMFAGYFAGKGSVKALFSYRIVPFVIIFSVFIASFGTLGRYRARFSDVFAKEYAQANSYVTIKNSFEDEDENQGTFLERSAIMAQLSNCVKLTKQKGFYEGSVSAAVAYALIPRFLWPEKPLVQLGSWFAVEIGTATIGDNGRANNSINMTIMGEFYVDFGWLGVVIGCFLFGGIIRMLWNSVEFESSPYNIIGVLFGGYVLLYSFGIGADLQLLVTYASTYLMLFTIKKVIVSYF